MTRNPLALLALAALLAGGCGQPAPMPAIPPPPQEAVEPPPANRDPGRQIEPYPFTIPPAGAASFVVPAPVAYQPLPASDLPTLRPAGLPEAVPLFDKYDYWPMVVDNRAKTAVFAHGAGGHTVGGYDGPELVVWDLPEARVVRRLRGHGFSTRRLWLSPDGGTLYAGGDSRRGSHTLRVWNLRTGELERERPQTPCWDLSSDGKTLVTLEFHGGGATPTCSVESILPVWPSNAV